MRQPPPLLQHGEHTSPLYEPLPGQAAARADDPQREAGQGGILRHFDKRQSASRNPAALGWVKATYPDAIEYTSKTASLKGLAFVWACFTPVFVVIGGVMLSAPFGLDGEPLWAVLIIGAMSLLGIGFILFGIWVTAFALRIDFFHLSDQPILFDRKHRRVYRLFSEMPSGKLGVFKPWPIRACVYEWDLIDAEHNVESVMTGATATSNHYLMFAVRKSADDPTIIDSFQIGNPMDLNEGLTAAMWEHIRRFMEENGPHLPTPDEPLANQAPPLSWWQGLGATGMLGPGYWGRWRNQPGTMLIMHLAGPVTVPMFLLWATGNLLSYKTEIKVDWPQAVKLAVGVPVKPPAAPFSPA